jgi:hypothetical protein
MRFFASWWERFPKHGAAALVAVVVAVGMTPRASSLFHMLVRPTGFSWG